MMLEQLGIYLEKNKTGSLTHTQKLVSMDYRFKCRSKTKKVLGDNIESFSPQCQ